jgi:hypothetical protein
MKDEKRLGRPRKYEDRIDIGICTDRELYNEAVRLNLNCSEIFNNALKQELNWKKVEEGEKAKIQMEKDRVAIMMKEEEDKIKAETKELEQEKERILKQDRPGMNYAYKILKESGKINSETEKRIKYRLWIDFYVQNKELIQDYIYKQKERERQEQ